MIGERTRTAFALGDELRVQVMAVNLDERKIDFEIVEVKTGRRKQSPAAPKGQVSAKEFDEDKPRSVRKRTKVANDGGAVKKAKDKSASQKAEGKKTGGKKAGDKKVTKSSAGKTPPKTKIPAEKKPRSKIASATKNTRR